jgi:hypothetical protein
MPLRREDSTGDPLRVSGRRKDNLCVSSAQIWIGKQIPSLFTEFPRLDEFVAVVNMILLISLLEWRTVNMLSPAAGNSLLSHFLGFRMCCDFIEVRESSSLLVNHCRTEWAILLIVTRFVAD